MLGSILMIMLFGFITGSLARLAVPGPDPMPIWLTVAIGLAGSAAGGGLAIALWGKGTQGIGIFSFIGAVLLVVGYRRFFQKRAIVGPEALKFPVKGLGIERFQERRQKLEDMARQARPTGRRGRNGLEPAEAAGPPRGGDPHGRGVRGEEGSAAAS